MKRIAGYRCTICGKEYPFGPELMTCPSCGEKGILDIVYDYSEIKSVFSKESLKKDNDNSMWRYRALMPIKGEGLRDFLRIGWTPLYRSLRLGRQIGLDTLYIKDDGRTDRSLRIAQAPLPLPKRSSWATARSAALPGKFGKFLRGQCSPQGTQVR
jgi:threonine synthase